MILTKIRTVAEYLSPEIRQPVHAFLQKINADMPDGEYEILGAEAFARVQTYRTVPPEDARIEAHDVYADIQGTLRGAEGISVYDRESLRGLGPYREPEDVCHYDAAGAEPLAHVNNLPGYATILLPADAHRPKERIDSTDEVKKFVIKVKAEYVDGV